MKTSETIIAFIKGMEGCRLTSYKCPAGVWTIGYGTIKINGVSVRPNMAITMQEADLYCRKDISVFENSLTNLITKNRINFENPDNPSKTEQNRFDALLSFSYNLGIGSLLSSTLLKKHNASEFTEAANQFFAWRYAAKKPLAGLTRRRSCEALHYFQGLDNKESQIYLNAINNNIKSVIAAIYFKGQDVYFTAGKSSSTIDEDDDDKRSMGIYNGDRYKDLL